MSTGVSVSRSNQVEWVESVIHDCVILDSNLHWITDWLMFILGETIRLIGSFLSELWLNKRLRPTFAAITLYPWSFLKSSRCADIICAGPSFLCLSVRVCVYAGPCVCMHLKQCSHFYLFYYIKLTQSHKHWQICARTNTRVLKDFVREILREQPENIYNFGARYFSELANPPVRDSPSFGWIRSFILSSETWEND